MSEELATYEVRKPAAIITLNRPDRRNALSVPLIDALKQAFERAISDNSVRAVIVTGTGSVFCAGMDLAELQKSLQRPAEESPVWDDSLRLATLYDFIYTLPKPTIAAVNGPAVAGGAGLVSVCDLAVGVPSARIGYPEVRRGLVAAMVMPHLLRHVGERAARFLLLTGDLVEADEAVQMGFLNRVVEPDQLMDQAMQWANSLAQGGPEALRKTKEFLHQFSQQSVSIEEAAKGSAAPRLSQECQEGLRAFFEKRSAPWIAAD